MAEREGYNPGHQQPLSIWFQRSLETTMTGQSSRKIIVAEGLLDTRTSLAQLHTYTHYVLLDVLYWLVPSKQLLIY